MCLGTDEQVDRVAALEREIATLQAAQMRELARLEAGACELACDATLLSLETRWSPGHVRNRLAEAAAAVERLPRMLQLLATGEIGAGTLGHLVHTVSVLAVERARELDAALAGWTNGHTHPQVTAKARRLVLQIDPEGAEARAGKRRTERRVEIEPDEDGMSTLRCGNLGQNCRYCDRAFRRVRGNLGPNCGTPRRRAQLPGPGQRDHPDQHAARRRDPR